MVDNHEAVKVGDREKNMESRPLVRALFTKDFPEAVVEVGADELALRREGLTEQSPLTGCEPNDLVKVEVAPMHLASVGST